MNPFTESTVARPLSEPSPAAPENDSAADTRQTGATPVPADPNLRPARYPRSGRLVRPRTRGEVLRRTGFCWPAACRRVAGSVLGTMLALSLPAAWAVNANSATAQQLESISGIGPKTAQVIIDERNRGGSFESFDDLAERVKGIGPKKARALQAAGLTVGHAAKAEPGKATSAQRKANR